MMSETTRGFLSTLTYRVDAKRRICWMPLVGLYWEDEMPDIRLLMNIPKDDRNQIFRLYSIRLRLWKNEPLPDAEQQFWNTTYSQVPSWAFFRRQQISEDEQHAQEQAEQESDFMLKDLLADADLVSISKKDGVQKFSATFNLTKNRTPTEKKHSWWKRVFTRRRIPEN
jgi:hypothetical protein